MKLKELIKILQEKDQEADVSIEKVSEEEFCGIYGVSERKTHNFEDGDYSEVFIRI